MRRRAFFLQMGLLTGLALMLNFGCFSGKKPVWIYTSIYKEVIAELDPLLRQDFPDLEIKWFQGGSENIAAKVSAELASGKAKADLVLTSDPFWYLELKEGGKLLPYQSPAAKEVSPDLIDPDHTFTAVRIPAMVLAYHPKFVSKADLPKSWKDLAAPQWRKKLSMGSPMESGTAFTTVALLSKLLGWSFYEDLRKQDLIAAGGNSSVITRIETGERPLGVVLLENVLKAQGRGSPIQAHYLQGGVIPIPSPIAILKDSSQPETAKKLYDWFFSAKAQTAIVKSGMYSPLASIEGPKTAPSWKELQSLLIPWNAPLAAELFKQRDQIKAKFSEILLH